MILFILSIITGIAALGVATWWWAERGSGDAGFVAALALGLSALTVLFFGLSTIKVVDPGKVGIPVSFGDTKEAVGAGTRFMPPWWSITEMNTRVQEVTFGDGEGNLGAISAQADGGGNLSVDLTVQYRLEETAADTVFEEIGTDYFEVLILPAARTCLRESATGFTAEEAYVEGRAAIGTATEECINADLEGRGIIIEDIKVRDVDPGSVVRSAIDRKQEAEQELQKRTVELQQTIIDAEKARVAAQGTYDSERIIACGGQPTTNDEGESVIVPNDPDNCDQRQFSAPYLSWLYIQVLDKMAEEGVGTFAIIPPGQELSPLIDIGQVAPQPQE